MSLRAAARAYPALLRTGFVAAVAYRAEFLIWMFSTNMPLVMLALWAAVARSGPVAGYTKAGFGAYYLAVLLVRLLTGAWVVWEMTFEIKQGTLALRLLRPIHPLIFDPIAGPEARWPSVEALGIGLLVASLS